MRKHKAWGNSVCGYCSAEVFCSVLQMEMQGKSNKEQSSAVVRTVFKYKNKTKQKNTPKKPPQTNKTKHHFKIQGNVENYTYKYSTFACFSHLVVL